MNYGSGNYSSSETQGQSVGSGERAARKFSSTGERAPGFRRPKRDSQSNFYWNRCINSVISFSMCHQMVTSEIREYFHMRFVQILIISIFGDSGAVSRVGVKGGTKVFKYGRKSPWVPTFTELFPKVPADAGSLLGTKNALYCCAQLANSSSWVLFLGSYTTAMVLPHLPGSFTKLVRAGGNLYILLSFSPEPTDCPWVSEDGNY